MRKKTGIIGHFGGDKVFLDGQTVKTKVLYEELTARGFEDIYCVDTYYNKTNKLRLILKSLKCLMTCNRIIVLLASNGLKIYLPMLYWAKKLLKIKVYHDVIGGDLAENVKKNPQYEKYLNSFDSNWVEFTKMKNDLEKLGIKNCDVVPNFKRLNSKNALPFPTEEGKYKFCMFSRVMREKGMTDAIGAIANYNATHEKNVFLEIWGPIDDSYKEEFDVLLKEYGEHFSYMGCVDFNNSVETLTDHMALLFPTFWEGEGFPGTIIDAYSSALPVIATDWNANSELIRNFETGWVYPNDKVKTLDESIEYAVENIDEMLAMRKNCKLFSTRCSSDFVMRKLIDKYLKD